MTGLMWGFRNLFQKIKILGDFWEKTFLGSIFGFFSCSVAIFGPICMKFFAPGLKLNLPATLFYKKIHFDQPFPRKRPPIFSPKTAKIGYFWKKLLLGPKIPPRGASLTWNIVLYAGYLYQPFWTIKIQPGRQEGPKTAKMGVFYERGFKKSGDLITKLRSYQVTKLREGVQKIWRLNHEVTKIPS